MTIDTLILATQNQGKVKEMKQLLSDLPIKLIGAREAGVTDDIEEDSATLEANSLKKATHLATTTHQWSMADDSGLFIDALNGAPGIYSTRWAGLDFPREQLPDFLLHKMIGVPVQKRKAHWECAIALVEPDGKHWIFKGQSDGKIAIEKRGTPRPNMPYDTIFLPAQDTRTFAEMNEREKKALSHRGHAIAKLKQFIIEKIS
jgi:XTP/dITP diphosphohydrolase